MASINRPITFGSRTTFTDSSEAINRFMTAKPNSLRVISLPLNASVIFTWLPPDKNYFAWATLVSKSCVPINGRRRISLTETFF